MLMMSFSMEFKEFNPFFIQSFTSGSYHRLPSAKETQNKLQSCKFLKHPISSLKIINFGTYDRLIFVGFVIRMR